MKSSEGRAGSWLLLAESPLTRLAARRRQRVSYIFTQQSKTEQESVYAMATEESKIWQKDSLDFYFCQTNRPILLQSIRSFTRIKHQLCDPPGVSPSRQFLYIIVSISRSKGGESFISTRPDQQWPPGYPGQGTWAHPACRPIAETRNPSVKTLFFRHR